MVTIRVKSRGSCCFSRRQKEKATDCPDLLLVLIATRLSNVYGRKEAGRKEKEEGRRKKEKRPTWHPQSPQQD
jgi:hypothetical protein